mmetsp:Transcript_25062/g.35083  ORF Transcript_25062/g.35083 Transcript_25062/m.35083 type:complete len:115 (-) Transcript_25062:86-430(-)
MDERHAARTGESIHPPQEIVEHDLALSPETGIPNFNLVSFDFPASAALGLQTLVPCLLDLSILAAFVANPASTGTAQMSDDKKPVVDINCLDHLADIDALSEAARTACSVKNAV